MAKKKEEPVEVIEVETPVVEETVEETPEDEAEEIVEVPVEVEKPKKASKPKEPKAGVVRCKIDGKVVEAILRPDGQVAYEGATYNTEIL